MKTLDEIMKEFDEKFKGIYHLVLKVSENPREIVNFVEASESDKIKGDIKDFIKQSIKEAFKTIELEEDMKDVFGNGTYFTSTGKTWDQAVEEQEQKIKEFLGEK